MAKGKQTLYTQQGYQELVDELYRRTHEEREKIKNDIATARGFGDLSENAEYDAARNDQAKNEARIKELEELIENAVIIDESIGQYVEKYAFCDCVGEMTTGQTVIDWLGFAPFKNVKIPVAMDREKFVKMYFDCVKSYDKEDC
jgi:inosine-uridine nucleoside N-ribohydrolase